MAIVYLDTYTVHNMIDNSDKQLPSLQAAHDYCQRMCGNAIYTKPFPEENTYLYGPGNGDTTLMIRQDIDMDAFMGRKSEKTIAGQPVIDLPNGYSLKRDNENQWQIMKDGTYLALSIVSNVPCGPGGSIDKEIERLAQGLNAT